MALIALTEFDHAWTGWRRSDIQRRRKPIPSMESAHNIASDPGSGIVTTKPVKKTPSDL